MSNVTVIPSLPAQSFSELEELAEALSGDIAELQVDIVDGQFVPSVSWPFSEVDPVSALAELSSLPSTIELEIDCMVLRPEQYLPTFSKLSVTRVIVHYGSTSKYEDILRLEKQAGRKVGLAFTNDVFIEADVHSLLAQFDYVQVMGIKEVGKQGQPFDERTLQTISSLRERYPALEIAVDGHVNEDTIAQLVKAGATRLAPGSAVAKASNPREALHTLRNIASVAVLDKSLSE